MDLVSSSPTLPVRTPLGELWNVAWPSILTMTSYTVMQFIDSFMVSRVDEVGPLYVAAQGNGGMFAWVLISIAAGLVSVVSAFVSQHLGAGTPRDAPRYVWAALLIGLTYWLAVLVPAAVLAHSLFELMHSDHALIRHESDYARILLFGAVFSIINRTLSNFFYGVHRPRIVFVGALAGNAVNILGNWLLIFGNWDFPEMGLNGAAVATVVGTVVECSIPTARFLSSSFERDFGVRSARKLHWRSVTSVVRVGWPAALQFGSEMICWYIFMGILVGRFGADHLMAGWATMRYCTLSFMPALGISTALTSVVGKYVGAGDFDTAAARAALGVRTAMVYMGSCALLFILFREQMISVFLDPRLPQEEREVIIRIGSQMMICAAVFQLFDALGVCLIGALRGAGDTIWPGAATFFLSWALIIGGGVTLVVFVPQLSSLGPWIAAASYVVVLGLCLAFRWKSGRWRQINLIGSSGAFTKVSR